MNLTNFELIILMIQNRQLAIQVIENESYKENVKQYNLYFNEVKYNLEKDGDYNILLNIKKKIDNKYYNKYQMERKLINLLDNIVKYDYILFNNIKRGYKKKYGKDINIDNFYKSITDKLYSDRVNNI